MYTLIKLKPIDIVAWTKYNENKNIYNYSNDNSSLAIID